MMKLFFFLPYELNNKTNRFNYMLLLRFYCLSFFFLELGNGNNTRASIYLLRYFPA